MIIPIIEHCYSQLQPEVVEKIVGLREGIPRKDAKEVYMCYLSGHVLKILVQNLNYLRKGYCYSLVVLLFALSTLHPANALVKWLTCCFSKLPLFAML